MVASSYAEYYGGGVLPAVAQEGARSGEILIELFIGDDYTGASALPWTVAIPDAATIDGSSCVLKFVQASSACTPFEIEFSGALTAAADGYATLTFAMLSAETATITEGEYFFFVTWITDSGLVITKVFNRQLVNWKSKDA